MGIEMDRSTAVVELVPAPQVALDWKVAPEQPIETTPSIAPPGWYLDIQRIQDEKIKPLVQAGFLPVSPSTQHTNRGITTWPESYIRDFREKEVVFLWKVNKSNGNGSNGNKSHSPVIHPVLYAEIGRDSNEVCDDTKYVLSREWETNGHCRTKTDHRRLQMAYNYLKIIEKLKESGNMPPEWTWEEKVAYWERYVKPQFGPLYGPENKPPDPVIPPRPPLRPPEEIAEDKKRSRQERAEMLLNLIDYQLKRGLAPDQAKEIACALAERAAEISSETS